MFLAVKLSALVSLCTGDSCADNGLLSSRADSCHQRCLAFWWSPIHHLRVLKFGHVSRWSRCSKHQTQLSQIEPKLPTHLYIYKQNWDGMDKEWPCSKCQTRRHPQDLWTWRNKTLQLAVCFQIWYDINLRTAQIIFCKDWPGKNRMDALFCLWHLILRKASVSKSVSLSPFLCWKCAVVNLWHFWTL